MNGNGLQHLTILTSLKFCLALCYSSGPNSSKFGPNCPQVGPNLLIWQKRWRQLFRANVNPDYPAKLAGDLPDFMDDGHALTLCLTTNFRLFQTEKVCRRQL